MRVLVSDHHERLDGSGYPHGLDARNMCIETRILAVCDVYDALVSDRVYRAAWSPERAFALLEEESHAYDPTVVAALRRRRCPGFVADLESRARRRGAAASRTAWDYPSAIERPLTNPSLDAIWSMTVSGTAPSVVIAMTARSLLSPSPGA